VTRAVTENRYVVDPALARPSRGHALERFVFVLSHPKTTATLLLNEGFVDDEFIALARTDARSAAQEERLDDLKRRLAARVMAAPAARCSRSSAERRSQAAIARPTASRSATRSATCGASAATP
jgi:hypothetical protein